MTTLGLVKLTSPAKADVPLGFCPTEGSEGDLIRLLGPNLGSDFKDLSISITNGNTKAFLRPLALDSGDAVTQIAAIPDAMLGGNVNVVLGNGAESMPNNLPNELTLNAPIRSWVGNGGPRYTSFQTFGFPMSGSNSCLNFWGYMQWGQLKVNISVPFDENCCPICPAGTSITLRFCGATANNNFEAEYQATLITTTPLYVDQLADAMISVMRSAFISEHNEYLNAYYTMLSDNEVSISIGSPSGNAFVGGAIQVIINHGADSMAADSMDCDSTNGDSMACDSMSPDCDSIAVDFVPFIFN